MNYIKIVRVITKLSIGLVALCGLTVIVLKAVEPALSKKIAEEVKKQLPYGCDIGEIRITIFENFPYITGQIDDVFINGTDSTTFIEAQQVNLQLDTWKLLRKEIEITSILLSDGLIRIFQTDDNAGNWNILSTDTTSKETSLSSISIPRATLRNMTLQYRDSWSNQDYHFQIEKGMLSAFIVGQSIELDYNIYTYVSHLDIGDFDLLTGKNITLKGKALLDLNQGFYQFKEVTLSQGQSLIHTEGSIHNTSDYVHIDFEFGTSEMPLEEGIDLLPLQIQSYLKEYKLDGQCSIKGNIKGKVTERLMPKIALTGKLTRGSLKTHYMDAPVEEINLNAFYSSDKYGIGKLDIPKFNAQYEAKDISGSLRIVDIQNPKIDLTFNGTIPVALLLSKEINAQFYAKAGKLDLRDFYISDYTIYSSTNMQAAMGGKCQIKNAVFLVDNHEIMLPNAMTELTNNDVFIVDHINLTYGDNDIALKGSIKNLILGVFRSEMSDKIFFDFSLQSRHLDLKEVSALLARSQSTTVETTTEEQVPYYNSLIGLRGKIRAEVGKTEYDKITINELKSSLFFNLDRMSIHSTSKTSKGKFNLDGVLEYSEAPVFKGNSEVIDMDIHSLFYEWNNFGQEVIKAEHLEGRINGQCLLELQWDNHGNLLHEQMEAKSTVAIQNGRLKNFHLLDNFSTYIDIKQLRDIHFSTLKNIIIVRNGNVYLPAMFIQSNAMNLTVNGIHTFDQQIDYNIKINAGQVISEKIRNNNVNNTLIPANESGWFNLYYTITGNLHSEFQYQQDKGKVHSSFWQSVDFRNRIEEEIRTQYPDIEHISEPIEWKDKEAYFDNTATTPINSKYIEFQQ